MPAAVSKELNTSKSRAQETEADDDTRRSSGKGENGGSNTYSEEANAVRGVSTSERQKKK